jgi:5-methylcytosine-specific restriction endonuclease McrA
MTSKRKKALRNLLWPKQRGLCCYCRRPMIRDVKSNDSRRVTIEHLRRICDGGTNHLDNLALACQDCNVRRGSTDWLTYASIKQGELVA